MNGQIKAVDTLKSAVNEARKAGLTENQILNAAMMDAAKSDPIAQAVRDVLTGKATSNPESESPAAAFVNELLKDKK